MNTEMFIRKSDNQVMDLYSDADRERGMKVFQGQRRNADKSDRVGELMIGIAGEGLDRPQKEVMESLGFTSREQSQASKAIATAKAFRQIGFNDRGEGLSDSKASDLQRNAENLETYWNYAHPELQFVTGFGDHCKALTGDDGAARAKVVVAHLSVFPSVSFAYDVARGAKFHPSDPRAEAVEVEAEPSERKDKTVDELLAELEALAGRCLRAGASVTDVVARVNTAAKAGQQADAA